jgi:hypothetical protein
MYFALLLRPAYIEQQQKKTIEEDQSGKNRKEKVYSLSLFYTYNDPYQPTQEGNYIYIYI